MNLRIADEYYGELLPYIKDERITDICWNGDSLWVDNLEKGRYKISTRLSDDFVKTFAARIANLANENFNMSMPLLEAETDDLRISIVHDSVTNTGISISIRKTPAIRRLNDSKMIEEGYAEAALLAFFELIVKSHCSIIVTGDVGSGKTEFVKYLTKHIPSDERTISIEDNFELRLASINPELDAVEIKASEDRFSYSMAIKAALRQLCKWLLLSEARSTEVVQLLEAASTGCIVMTTIHSDNVRKIPDRMVNMMGLVGEEKRNDVYNFFDVGIKIDVKKTENGIQRKVSQICIFDRDEEINTLTVIYDEGFVETTVTKNVWKKIFESADESQKEYFEHLKGDYDE